MGSGFDHRFDKFQGPLYIHHEMLLEALRHQTPYYNMFGISGDLSPEAPDAGVLRFKRLFKGQVEELIPAYNFFIWPKCLAKWMGLA